MKIRNVNPKDLSELLELEYEAFNNLGLNAVTMRQQIDLFSKVSFVAEQDQKIVGFVIGGVSIGKGKGEGWILDVVVRREYQQKGIGTKLLQACIKALMPLCYYKILLTVAVEATSPSRFLYKKLGFVKSKFDPNYFGKNSPRVIMKLNWN